MISYELAMGLALLAIILMNGSLDLKEIAANQSDFYGLGWNISSNRLHFGIFCSCFGRNQ
jgi:NADH-quinone oxidoreductase subunit H